MKTAQTTVATATPKPGPVSGNSGGDAAAEQHAALGLDAAAVSSTHTEHPEAQWFPTAGLGLFVHWGIASVHGDLDLSWAMIANTRYDQAAAGRNKLTPEAYWKLADRFSPMNYDPDRWLAAAAKAGFQYALLTAMHHDGYTLWPSKVSDFGVQSQMGGRDPGSDLVGPFVEACRRHGLKVGLYYSPPDWHYDRRYMSFNYRSDRQEQFPGRRHFDTHHQPVDLPPRPAGHDARGREIFHGRVRELLTRYGRIDLLWFDGGAKDNAARDLARGLQPHIVINSRACDGDFDCTECCLPGERFRGWFETPHCWQASDLLAPSGNTVDFWGYLKEEQYKSTAWMLEHLVKLRTWGGNLLINVGPGPDGALPAVVYDRFAEVGQWMKLHGKSVVGTASGPYPERCNVPVTVGPGGWFLHFLRGPGEAAQVTESVAVLQDAARPEGAWLLGDGRPVAWTWNAGTLRVTVEPHRRTGLVDVVAVRWA